MRNKLIHKDLERVYKSLASEDIIESNIKTARIIIFSDQHRGVRDGADDFQLCENAYSKALKYYYENGYTLIILGDAEDLWECRHTGVMQAYKDILNQETGFFLADEKRYYRIYGNHDDYWGNIGSINLDGVKIPVKEKVMIKLLDENSLIGNIFLVHGHQGYCFKILSRLLVRYLWRPFQRITRIKSTTPASDSSLRGKLNHAMYDWALNKNNDLQKLLLIAGHTHHPVFASRDHPGKIKHEISILEAEYQNATKTGLSDSDSLNMELKSKKDQLENYRKHEGLRDEDDGISMEKPCYFNTGCCSYSDGDITGIEISNGNITLIKWSKNGSQSEVLESSDIDGEVFNKL